MSGLFGVDQPHLSVDSCHYELAVWETSANTTDDVADKRAIASDDLQQRNSRGCTSIDVVQVCEEKDYSAAAA